MDQEQRKANLKKVKEERAPFIKPAAAAAVKQKKILAAIKERLAKGPATPVELAEDLSLSPKEAMWYLAAMRKYGMVAEAGKAGDYFNYQLAPQQDQTC